LQGGEHQRFARHILGGFGLRECRIFIHLTREQACIHRAPVDADADGFIFGDGDFHHLRELRVVLFAEADIARVDAIFGERFGHVVEFGEQAVAVVMEVADQRYVTAQRIKAVADGGHGARGGFIIHRDAHQFGARVGERFYLRDGSRHIGGIGVGH
jgi:hypothetical protein